MQEKDIGGFGKVQKLTNRKIVEILYHNYLILDPRVTEIGLQDDTILFLKDGELYKSEEITTLPMEAEHNSG